MRILYAAPGYKPARRMGGPIASVSAAAEGLARKGHQVTVVTTSADLHDDMDVPLDRPVDIDGVTVRYFGRRELLKKWLPFVPYLSRSAGYMYAPAMKAALETLVPQHDVVHTQMPFVYPTYAAARAALRHGKPLVYHQRGIYIPARMERRKGKKALYTALVEKPVMRRAAALVALTEAERLAFRALAPETPCALIPNGVDVPEPDPGAAQRVAERLGIPPHAALILYLGRLETWKGPEDLLQTFARVQNEVPDAYLVMAGADECGAGERWPSVARQEGWSDRLIFTGTVEGQEKSDLLHRADLFCLPSTAEGMSMAALEALAHSTAVMLSPGCNFPEAEAAGAGVTVEKDVEQMVAAMTALLRDRGRLRAMGEAGRELALRRYSWDVITEQLIDLYGRVIRSAAAS